MSAVRPLPLPEPPRGFDYYQSKREVLRSPELFPYQHMLLRAWEDMNLSGILTLDGVPTVYVRDEIRPMPARAAAIAHRQFWNQGIATTLLLRDPGRVRVFSSMTVPANPDTATERDIEQRLVEQIDLATQASWAANFYVQIGTGSYYSGHRQKKFDPKMTVDAYLLANLAAVRDELVDLSLRHQVAHAFLGRLLFTCYLCDREIIDLSTYFDKRPLRHLHELLSCDDLDPHTALYGKLFPELQRKFNGSMFEDDLAAERSRIKKKHLEVVGRFLKGDDLAHRPGQHSLGFWAYDFKYIPVETISAIYENFLSSEDNDGKHASGAFYTPRFLAETAVKLALEDDRPLYEKGRRFLDPACGSGIFLVLLFNRLAAEWRAAQTSDPSPQEAADALLERLASLQGIDRNLTACRIACFSLYLAFLDNFDPPGVDAYKLQTGKKLPSLLRARDSSRKPDMSVVWEGDFFDFAPKLQKNFDLIVGNPPWAGRGSKQVAQQFLERTTDLLKDSGKACLLVTSKVFLNQTDTFQARWLRRVTLEKVLQLADYRFILFADAHSPCSIALFNPSAPDLVRHEIEYVTPKVSRVDLRDGIISVEPQDRTWLPLRVVLEAAAQKASGIAWKSRFWGTHRDLKFLDYLFTFPRLSDLVGRPGQVERGQKRWCEGDGFQPLRETSRSDRPTRLKWSLTESFVAAEAFEGLIYLPERLTEELGRYLERKGYLRHKAHRVRNERIYKAPLVLWNKGFSQAAFFDYSVRFQDALRSISGDRADVEPLMFLAAYLRSPLARYVMFHTAASLGTERDQVHLSEALRLPFFLPGDPAAQATATDLVSDVAKKIRRFKDEIEKSAKVLRKRPNATRVGPLFDADIETEIDTRDDWLRAQRKSTENLQDELNPLIYEYFGLNGHERALVEDTCDLFDASDTPHSLDAARNIPTLRSVNAAGLKPYANMLTEALNGWATGVLRVSASGGVDGSYGLALVELQQGRTAEKFTERGISDVLASALKRLQEASTEIKGSLRFRRSGWYFDGPRIHIVKPAVGGQWSRTAALNDAADIHAHITEARRKSRAE